MTNTIGQPVVLSPSPRHMRKRRFRGEVPPSQLPGHRPLERPVPEVMAGATVTKPGLKAVPAPVASSPSPEQEQVQGSKKATLRQKRLIALAALILVSISIPLLVLSLMFAA
ncbi:hypothetical protein ACIQC5_01105 [Paenarthrobacter sp. NPDC092416]|uniref:hypothetical protein n=1 Tax=Paenarthrobacter sp. NPDC092416 TaxID=3364386 RepID=UPI00380392FE